MYKNFLQDQQLTKEELLNLVLNYHFEDVYYHSDDYGHVQVQMGEPVDSCCCSFNSLIEQVELMELWPTLIKRLAEQPEQWLNEFSVRLVQHPGKSQLSCLTAMNDCYRSDKGRLFHLLSASTWPWEYGKQQDLLAVQEQLQQARSELDQNADELHLAMLDDTLQKLDSFQHKP